MAKLIQTGHQIDYTPGADVAAGAVVVQGGLVGVAHTVIPANTLGSLGVSGVYQFDKAAGGGTAIAVGVNAYWDAAESEATADDDEGGNVLLGKAVATAGDAATTVNVLLGN
ncbi:MAG: DUF2190 family protein [Phycisphaerales bacterium]|nr:DUF2190 family protein [Phycisphaerales bacterium]